MSRIRRPDRSLGSPATGRASRYKLDKDIISSDLTGERPLYILSAYGPGRDAPQQLFGGRPREQSFEELRTRHYELSAQGRQQEAIGEAQALVENAEQQMKTALNDLDGAIKYICDGENEHPNRIDTCKAKGQLPKTSEPSLVSQPSFSQTSRAPGFGQPATIPASSNPSAPAFGKPSTPLSKFGQVTGSTFSNTPTPPFGQSSTPASTLGQTPSPAFGQPAALGRPTTSFGQPSLTLGQTSLQAPAFGQPSSQAPAFGQPSVQAQAFGRPSVQGQPLAQPPALSPFTRPSQSAFKADGQSQNPFGASAQPAPFGQNINTPSVGGALVAPSGSNHPNPFGPPTATAPIGPPTARTDVSDLNPFGAPAQHTIGGGSRGHSNPVSNPFGQPLTQPQSRPLDQSSTNSSSMDFPTANAAVTRRPSIPSPASAVRQKDAQHKLITWKGKEVCYIDDNPHFRENAHSEWQRIWFPDGPPVFTKSEDLSETAYDAATKEKYRFAMEFGRFENSTIPLMPPRKDWCNWNL